MKIQLGGFVVQLLINNSIISLEYLFDIWERLSLGRLIFLNIISLTLSLIQTPSNLKSIQNLFGLFVNQIEILSLSRLFGKQLLKVMNFQVGKVKRNRTVLLIIINVVLEFILWNGHGFIFWIFNFYNEIKSSSKTQRNNGTFWERSWDFAEQKKEHTCLLLPKERRGKRDGPDGFLGYWNALEVP